MSDKNFSQKFILDKRTVTAESIKNTVIFNAILLIFMIFVMFILIKDGSYEIFYVIGIYGIIEVIYFLYIFIFSFTTKAGTPVEITVTPERISVDEETIDLKEIKTVLLTPPSYVGAHRRALKLTMKNGKSKTYFLGFGNIKNNKIFPEYEKFANLLFNMFNNEPGKFQFDL